MKVHVFSVLDSKIGSFAQPWFSPTVASGLRAFSEAAQDGQSTIAKHPGDFSLYLLGVFDDETGEFSNSKPASLGTASAILASSLVEK